MSDEVSTENYYRILSLILDVGTPVLRAVLTSKVPQGESLQAVLSDASSKHKIEKLKRDKRLTPPQVRLLNEDPPSSKKFDISLLVTLLTNIMPDVQSPANSWKNDPAENDLSLGADLLRIRALRNSVYAHQAEAKMEATLFAENWAKSEEVIKRLAESVNKTVADETACEIKAIKDKTIIVSDREKLRETFGSWFKQDIASLKSQIESLEESLTAKTCVQETHGTDDSGEDSPDAYREALDTSLQPVQTEISELRAEVQSLNPESYQRLHETLHQQTQQDVQSVATVVQQLKSDIQTVRNLLDLVIQPNVANLAGRNQGAGDAGQDMATMPKQVTTETRTPSGAAPPPAEPLARVPPVATAREPPAHQTKPSPGSGTAEPLPGAGRVMSDQELSKLAGQLSRNWQFLALELGYDMDQTHVLEDLYPNKVTMKIFKMLSEWQKVVARHGYRPRLLLAKGVWEQGNREVASKVVGSEQALKEVTGYRLGAEAAKAVKNITFDEQPGSQQTATQGQQTSGQWNIGGKDSLNIYGGKVKMKGLVLYSSATKQEQQMLSIPDLSSLTMEEKKSGNIGGSGGSNIFNPELLEIDETIELGKSQPGTGYDEVDRSPGPEARSSELKKNSDDTLAADIVPKLDEVMKSVGAIVYGSHRGTGFRVGTKYVMTAWHVVRDIVDPEGSGFREYRNLQSASINFGVHPFDIPGVFSYKVSDSVPFQDENLDIAVLELLNPGSAPQPLPLHQADITQTQVQRLCFIGYGHPKSHKKHLEPDCRVIPQSSGRVKVAHDWLIKERGRLASALSSQGKTHDSLNWGYNGWDNQDKVVVNIYQEKGASGAPGLVYEAADRIKVMAVLTNGLPHCFWELPLLKQATFPVEHRLEQGIKMSAIHAKMRNKDSALAQDIFSVGM